VPPVPLRSVLENDRVVGRADRSFKGPHFDLQRVHMAVALRRVHLTRKALTEARAILPSETIKVSTVITEVVGRLEEDQFEFCQQRDGSWVDVYRVYRDGLVIWIKIKLETGPDVGEEVVVISFHEFE